MSSPPAPTWLVVGLGLVGALMASAGFALMAIVLWERYVEPRLRQE